MKKCGNDTLARAVTPEGVEFFLSPAGFMSRALALAIDNIVIGLAFSLIVVITAATGVELGNWITFLILFALSWFYHVFWDVFGKGASPGKRAMGLRVVSRDGSMVTAGASITRNLARFADGFLGLSLIGLICMAFSPGFRRLGDWAASTLVVYSRIRKDDAFAVHRSGSDSFHLPAKTALSGSEKMAILSYCRRYPFFGEELADEIAGELVPALTDDSAALNAPGYYLLSVGRALAGGGEEG